MNTSIKPKGREWTGTSPTPSSGRCSRTSRAGWRHESEEPCSKPPVDAAVRSCCQEVIVTCRGGNLRTCWWTPALREAVTLKKEAFQAWLVPAAPEAADRYREAERKEHFEELLNPTSTSWQSLKDSREDVTTSPQRALSKSGYSRRSLNVMFGLGEGQHSMPWIFLWYCRNIEYQGCCYELSGPCDQSESYVRVLFPVGRTPGLSLVSDPVPGQNLKAQPLRRECLQNPFDSSPVFCQLIITCVFKSLSASISLSGLLFCFHPNLPQTCLCSFLQG